ncbi:hypothetical protein PVK06_039515 [Gossypium arboreum]|uniref:Uncharacterized protein n=1 Tax=Gossypium arboreum TaxID=29729 RepID=A0ABR0N344_GOSAR|nr:hypothetical protein PVK06_039515 [Gossypium arboreum]
MREFQDFVNSLDVADIGYVGPSYTWSNLQQLNFIAKKLDRVLINLTWLLAYPLSLAEFLAPRVSDNCFSIAWFEKSLSTPPPPSPNPYIFFNFWTQHEDFLSVVAESWQVPI